MKLHPRTMPVQQASSVIHAELWQMQDRHGLTYAEMLQVLLDHQRDITKYLLREERHPGHPDRKADEA